MRIAEKQPLSYYEIPRCRVNGFVGQENILLKINKAFSSKSGPHCAVLQVMGD